MNKQISFYLTSNQYEAVEKVARVMRAQVNEVAAAALLQDLNGFDHEDSRVAELLESLRVYSDGSQVPEIKL